MENWENEYVDFMKKIGDYDDLCYAIVIGKKNKEYAFKIMNYIREHNLNTFGMWEEESDQKYDEYEKFLVFLDTLTGQTQKTKHFSNFKKQD